MKRALTVIMTAVLLAVSVLPSFAADFVCDCGNDPLIIVNGMGYAPFYVDKGTSNEHQVFPPTDAAQYAEIISEAIVAIRQGVILGEWHRFESKVIPALYDLFKEFRCAPDGTSVYNVSTLTYDDSMENYPDALGGMTNEQGMITSAVERLPARHAYDYNYDWRMSPLKNADNLRALIEYAKQNSGHDKVDIICASMGGIQTMGYIYKYGTDDIDSITFNSSTFTGVDLVGDVFTKAIEIKLDDVVNFVGEEVDNGEKIEPLYSALSAIGAAGLTQKKLDEFVDTELDNVYDRILIPVFGYMQGVWALCREDKYEQAKEIILKNATPEFIKEIDEMHYNVLNKAESIINTAKSNGTKIYVFSHYDYYAIPLYERDDAQSDGMLETEGTSGFATVALHNQTLGDGYVQKKDTGHNHVSPDNIIDASTCICPESTWFIKNLYHVRVARNTGYEDLMWKLLSSDKQLTVDSFKEYPQFMMADSSFEIYPIYNMHDLDGDGFVTTTDARLCLRGAAGIDTLAVNQLFAATGDDKATTATTDNAIKILREAIGIAS